MRTKSLERKMLEKIKNAYSAIGPQKNIKNSNVFYFHGKYWRNSVISPVFVADNQVSTKMLNVTSQHFSKLKVNSPFDSVKPYINFISAGLMSGRDLKVFKKNGWKQEKWSRKHVLNAWTKPIAARLPPGYSAVIGNYFDKRLLKDHWQVMNTNFPLKKNFRKFFDLWHKKVSKNVKTVVIYRNGTQPVASGLVITGKSGSFLYCGSVLPRFRGQGLWKCLTAIRQSVSFVEGGVWILLSENPQIKRSGDICLNFRTFTFDLGK
jgi:hypothetical protein